MILGIASQMTVNIVIAYRVTPNSNGRLEDAYKVKPVLQSVCV